jgi:hypothetical protein
VVVPHCFQVVAQLALCRLALTNISELPMQSRHYWFQLFTASGQPFKLTAQAAKVRKKKRDI